MEENDHVSNFEIFLYNRVLGSIYLQFPLKFPLPIKQKWEFFKKEFPLLLLNRKWELMWELKWEL